MRAPGPSPSSAPAPRPAREQVSRSTPKSHDERRRFERHDLAAEIGMRSESNFYTGFSDDLSEGGLFVATYALLPVGARVEVSFWLPSGHEIKCTAEVRWVRDPRHQHDDHHTSPGMGVRFLGLSSDDQNAIRHFMEYRPPMFFDDEG